MNKKLLILSLLFSTSILHASTPFGRVVDIKGSAFISVEGKTKEVKKGDNIYAHSEIVVEQNGQVTFTDNADHRFHIGQLGSVAILKGNKFELRSGDLWIQSLNKIDAAEVVTANAKIEFDGGEAIISYDSVKSKSQLMVINGMMKFSNLRSPELNLTVAEGNFSFVDLAFEEGMPRDPTPVGEKTYGKLVSLFKGVSPLDKNAHKIFEDVKPHGEKHASTEHQKVEAKREIASVKVEDDHQIKVMKDQYLDVMLKKKNHTHAEVKNKTEKKTSKTEKTMIKIYGQTGSAPRSTTAIYDMPAVNFNISNLKTAVKTSNRMPASAAETVLDQAVPSSSSESLNNMNTIPTSPLYKESDKLIKELNNL
jgi:hypothetical protein